MLRRAALFTDQPVMAAEFAYGDLDSESLTAEEDYGALGSESLLEEEEYGDDDDDDDDDDDFGVGYGGDDDDDDDDDFGALGSESLLAEEEYGAGLERQGAHQSIPSFGEWYGEDDDDDDDDDDFGGHDDDDDDDDEIGLADLEAEIDEDLYGAWYSGDPLAQRVQESGISKKGMNALEDSVAQGAVLLPQFLQENPDGRGIIDDVLEFVMSLSSPGDAKEIAAYIAGDPNLGNWNAMNWGHQLQIVRNAVASAALPGIEMTAPGQFLDAFEQHYQGGIFSAAKSGSIAAVKGAWAVASNDLPRAWAAVLGDIPIGGKMLTELQDAVGKPNWDDMVNPLAVGYVLVGFVHPGIYGSLVESITQRAQLAIQEAGATRDVRGAAAAAYQTTPLGPIPTVTQPPHAVAVTQPMLPRPQTVLAFGYAVMAGGAVLGVFKG